MVSAALLSFGTFWTVEGLGGPAAWALADWSLPILFTIFAGTGLASIAVLRRREAVVA